MTTRKERIARANEELLADARFAAQTQAARHALQRMNGPDWRNTRPAAYDREAKPQPLALFPEPDRTGTPDLFDTTETDPEE